jgi:mannose-6-phosphate isomerase-like protein (cupin superfamily)
MREFEHNHLPDNATPRRWTLTRTASLLPPVGATPRSAAVYEHGSLLLKLFAPHRTDPQQPHTRDEIYVVAQGKGWFVNGDVRHAFGPADVLFVPAGVVHRFEDFSDDLMLWVVFYGPEGGEKPVT